MRFFTEKIRASKKGSPAPNQRQSIEGAARPSWLYPTGILPVGAGAFAALCPSTYVERSG
jgi:hypothetical protein